MKYYHSVPIENLSIIQAKVFKLFPLDRINKTTLFYLPNNVELFLSIPELKEELDKLGWTEYVDSFAFYCVQKTKGSTLHTDTGDRLYSFNIPIMNCRDTQVNFYTSESEPETQLHGEGVDYNRYNPDTCTLVDSLEMIMPHVIKVKEVHNIVNNNYGPRITLLVRLNSDLNLDHLFYEAH